MHPSLAPATDTAPAMPARRTRTIAPEAVLAAGVVVVLVAMASRYGPHRDELYFVAAGHHPAWGYADQGPLTPMLARLMTSIAPGSLTVLRLPAALAAGATILCTGRLARELGGGRRAAAIAAACVAVASLVLFTGHMLSTSTFDLLVWTATMLLVVRAIRTGDDRLWPAAGVVLGLGLLNKALPGFLAAGLLAGVVVAGPRDLLRNRWVWAGAAIALGLWSPWIAWQAAHGWPQVDVSRSIAAGASTSSQPWWTLVPTQLLLLSPVLAPVWIAGLVRLVRDPDVRAFRFVAWAWVALAIVFMASGGKPYYLGGLLPALVAAGAVPVDRWLNRGRTVARGRLLAAAIGLSAVVNGFIALPLLPARDAAPVVAMNPDVAETIGWPDLVRTVARVYRAAPSGARPVIFTSNYGEAGAVERYGPALGLPHAYSGHNAYGSWGPPPAGARPVVTVGVSPSHASAAFRGCRQVATVANGAGIDNDEAGAPVLLCAAPRRPWPAEWPALRHLG